MEKKKGSFKFFIKHKYFKNTLNNIKFVEEYGIFNSFIHCS